MAERILSRIATIDDLNPIAGADAIVVASIDGWKVVVKKDEFKVGDRCVYCEIDSILPEREEFEFLRKVNFRIKTIRLRGQISQGIAFPISILSSENRNLEVGSDVTEILGVVKYEKPVPVQMAGTVLRYFPSFIRKTDEERIQNLSKKFDMFKGHLFYASEKAEGSSLTCYRYQDVFGVCSRNIELKEDDVNLFWKAAKKYNLQNILPEGYAVQGELIGPGIQGNIYKLQDIEVRVFNIWNIKEQSYLSLDDKIKFSTDILNMQTVPILDRNIDIFSMSVDQILTMAEGKSVLNNAVEREGLVFRSQTDEFISFKAISNRYLISNND